VSSDIKHCPVYGCELVSGPLDRDGYAFTFRGNKRVHLHRLRWAEAKGPIPANKVLHHTCCRRNCVALAHLELTSQSDNLYKRSWKRVSRQTRCSGGHDLFLHGRRTPEAGRICVICSGIKEA
jgi:hypothetical protein